MFHLLPVDPLYATAGLYSAGTGSIERNYLSRPSNYHHYKLRRLQEEERRRRLERRDSGTDSPLSSHESLDDSATKHSKSNLEYVLTPNGYVLIRRPSSPYPHGWHVSRQRSQPRRAAEINMMEKVEERNEISVGTSASDDDHIKSHASAADPESSVTGSDCDESADTGSERCRLDNDNVTVNELYWHSDDSVSDESEDHHDDLKIDDEASIFTDCQSSITASHSAASPDLDFGSDSDNYEEARLGEAVASAQMIQRAWARHAAKKEAKVIVQALRDIRQMEVELQKILSLYQDSVYSDSSSFSCVASSNDEYSDTAISAPLALADKAIVQRRRQLEDWLTKSLIRADGILTRGNESVREHRRAFVYRVQSILEDVDKSLEDIEYGQQVNLSV